MGLPGPKGQKGECQGKDNSQHRTKRFLQVHCISYLKYGSTLQLRITLFLPIFFPERNNCMYTVYFNATFTIILYATRKTKNKKPHIFISNSSLEKSNLNNSHLSKNGFQHCDYLYILSQYLNKYTSTINNVRLWQMYRFY